MSCLHGDCSAESAWRLAFSCEAGVVVSVSRSFGALLGTWPAVVENEISRKVDLEFEGFFSRQI
jgi:hypothetical protein